MQISIPGATDNSGIDTNKLIEDLLEAEKQPLTRLEEKIDSSKNQISIWQATDNDMTLLQDYSKKLYSYNNPFNERSVSSSEPQLVDASAQRNASLGRYKVYSKKLASADRWLSQTIPDNYEIPRGTYTFHVGEKIISFKFNDNSIEELIDAINSNGKKYIKADIIKKGVQEKDNVLLLESLVIGSEGKLSLEDTAKTFGKDIYLIGKNNSKTFPIPLNKDYIDTYISNEELFNNTTIPPLPNPNNDNTTNTLFLELLPGASGSLRINAKNYQEILGNPESSITIELYAQAYDDDKTFSDNIISTSLEDIKVEGDKNIALSNVITTTTEVTNTTNNQTSDIKPDDEIAINTMSSTPPLPILLNKASRSIFDFAKTDIEEATPIVITIPAASILDSTSNQLEFFFTLINPFPEYKITISQMSVSNNATNNDLVPLQAINNASNAVVEFNGIDIERNSNTITDVIPGITLNLKRADEHQEVEISVNTNEELIKTDIINFVGAYNQTIRSLIVYTSNDPKILDNLKFQSEEERKTASENLGTLSREFTFTRLISTMQNIMISQYNNSENSNISSLRSIGIAANISGSITDLDQDNRFLDIDESALDKAIAENSVAIAKLLGTDTNNDVAIDYGVAYQMSNTIQPYVQINGIINQKQQSLKNTIDNDDKELARYQTRLERYEQELRRKFGNMESTVGNLKRGSEALRGFTNNNNNNNNR